jgi:hypothetical protein
MIVVKIDDFQRRHLRQAAPVGFDIDFRKGQFLAFLIMFRDVTLENDQIGQRLTVDPG